MTEKVKELTTKAADQEGRADDLDRELKSLNNKFSDLEGKVILQTTKIFIIVVIIAELEKAEKKYDDLKSEHDRTLEELEGI